MLRRITIQNYKSILDDTIELGRVNVFIGENGCGKSNVLEAVAMAGAGAADRLESEELFNRGIRLARPGLTLSAFAGVEQPKAVSFKLWPGPDSPVPLTMDLVGRPAREPSWKGIHSTLDDFRAAYKKLDKQSEPPPSLTGGDMMDFMDGITNFVVYNISTLALRGLNITSRKQPLGIYGEGLDVAIAGLSDELRRDLTARASCIAWMEDIVLDAGDRLKLQGFKPARSTSTLYFVDRFLTEGNYFSAENANEGILHILFYLVLFCHPATPRMFGIDNIEAALNPQLCRDLMKQVADLAKVHDKQALITTHNPAILDGLNLNDDDQRLFVVERNDEGHTTTRRITLKPDSGDGQKYKLSELWMRGFLGGLPRGF